MFWNKNPHNKRGMLKLEEKKYSLMVKLVIQTKIILAMEHLDILCLGGIHFDIKDLI